MRNPYSPALLLTIEDLSRLTMEGKDLESFQPSPNSPPASQADNPPVEAPNGVTSSCERTTPVVPNCALTPVTTTSGDSSVGSEAEIDGIFSTPNFGGNAALDYIYKKKKPVAAVFVHAGAGYHSHINEHLHLQACADAARVGMAKLKQGGSAVEAVVEAIKNLENNSVANAGFGSNLCIDGTVECDATVVDHNGRSGAVGACPHIKNPITLAELVLRESYKAMALRRIPPILLIGSGACEFAHAHGMTLASNDDMVSTNARDRWEKWNEELQNANGRTKPAESVLNHPLLRNRDHVAAILTGTFNEGQPDSPLHETSTPAASPTTPPLRRSPGQITPIRSGSAPARSPSPPAKRVRLISPTETLELNKGLPSPKLSLKPGSPNRPRAHGNQLDSSEASRSAARGGQGSEEDSAEGTKANQEPPKETKNVKNLPKDHPADNLCPSRDRDYASPGKDRPHDEDDDDDDRINDTVGVIAIDSQGRIAAGSSSGGIGMKHRGRVGPAALVGIGTAVIPADEGDAARQATVAAVTSGTGEHMATAMAAHKCAERLYQGSVRGADGYDVRCSDGDDDEIMASFVEHDFMSHPGVRAGEARPAIGVMAVKKVANGYYFYFAHNTESFAIASMAASDRAPKVVMSRMPEYAVGVRRPLTMRGARKISA
ncbi:hypothetical protein RB601_003855 [Gaeumannomyces tritici]